MRHSPLSPALAWILAGTALALSACADSRVKEFTNKPPEGEGERGRIEVPPGAEPEAEKEVDLSGLIDESSRIVEQGYRFLPGDLIEISVFQYPDLHMKVRVPRDLQLNYPMIGMLDLTGMVVKDLEMTLRTRLEEKFIPRAQVSVLPIEFAPRPVYITGNVKNGGAFAIPPMGTLSLLQLVSLAGGFTEDADRGGILLIREREPGSRSTYRISYPSIERKGKLNLDVYLLPGDRLLVPTQQRVYVLGSVNHPGGFSLSAEGLTASKAIALAQGFTRLAAPNSTVVIREKKDGSKTTFKVPLSSILELGNEELDLNLQPGDVVYVPESLF
jgi:polysaccharide export outer membrane protein